MYNKYSLLIYESEIMYSGLCIINILFQSFFQKKNF